MSKKNRKGDTLITNSGTNHGQIFNNENGTINNYHYSIHDQRIKPEIFVKKVTSTTPEKAKNLATISLLVEILAFVGSLIGPIPMISFFVLILVIILIAATYPTFRVMDRLKRQRFSMIPPIWKWVLSKNYLLLNKENKIVQCDMEFLCPKCGSKLIIVEKLSARGYYFHCPRNRSHNFDFDYTILDDF